MPFKIYINNIFSLNCAFSLKIIYNVPSGINASNYFANTYVVNNTNIQIVKTYIREGTITNNKIIIQEIEYFYLNNMNSFIFTNILQY
jgi:hypothetical protein